MKTTILALVALQMATLTTFAKTPSKDVDPVVMKIGDVDVKLSEFEYLYKKNDAQQSADISLDQYIDMFVNYKLKVCAAKAAGLDTTAAYRSDIEKYSAELATPYMVDRQMVDSLIGAAYSHRMENVTVRHLMLPTRTKERGERAQLAFADSLRQAVVNGADFETVIRQHSVDQAARQTGGLMNLTGGRVPYRFEDVAYQTAVGEVSPVFQTMFGLHIIRVEDRRPDIGEVKARHILKITRGLSDDEAAIKRQQIDSIYAALRSGADFVTIASQETEDPSGRGNGGELPWFGAGRMIPEFETTAFGLADGEISEPFPTSYGYHIVLREAHRQTLPLDSVRDQIEESLMRDYRLGLAERRCVEKYGADMGATIDGKAKKQAIEILKSNGGYNAAARQALGAMNKPLLTLGSTAIGADAVVKKMAEVDILSPDRAATRFESTLDDLVYDALRSHFKSTLADREPAYRNLFNEYSDGMLLYEISNREVWDKANTDHEGLEAYFQAHRDQYVWAVPHYRGFLISAVNDSIASAAVAYASTLDVEESQLGQELRKKFGNTAKIDRVNAGRGDNAIIDYVAFGGDKPADNNRWTAFREFRGAVIDQPQAATDVKGLVSMGYQQQLEEQWIQQLRRDYPIVVNRDVIHRALK